MSINVGTLWCIYVITLLLFFAIFAYILITYARTRYQTVGYGTAFFLGSILGAIAVFIGAAWLDPNNLTYDDKNWLSVLFVVAFMIPVFAILYTICVGEYKCFTNTNCAAVVENACDDNIACPFIDKLDVREYYDCDVNSGSYILKKKRFYKNGKSIEVNFINNDNESNIVNSVLISKLDTLTPLLQRSEFSTALFSDGQPKTITTTTSARKETTVDSPNANVVIVEDNVKTTVQSPINTTNIPNNSMNAPVVSSSPLQPTLPSQQFQQTPTSQQPFQMYVPNNIVQPTTIN